MTEEAMKDLLLKHDTAIQKFAQSIEHLAQAQSDTSREIKETGRRLEEITKYLAKQQVFSSKLEAMDRELVDSFKRVHKRIDDIETTQRSDAGCSSVKLINRDVAALTKEVNRLVGIVEEHRLNLERLDRAQARSISPTAMRWAAGFIVAYLISFGTYVVQTFNRLERTDAKLTTLLERDIKDTAKLMERIK